jgi:Resolvase, N terminal domain
MKKPELNVDHRPRAMPPGVGSFGQTAIVNRQYEVADEVMPLEDLLETHGRFRAEVPSLGSAPTKPKGRAPGLGSYIYARSAVWDIESINSQIHICAKLIRESGRRVQLVCADNGTSGNAIGGGLRELLGEARQGRVTHLVVADRDRLGRPLDLLVSILETLQTCGVRVTFADGTPSLRPGEPLQKFFVEERGEPSVGAPPL